MPLQEMALTKPKYSIFDYAWSKWEFLRRNDQYINLFEEYSKARREKDSLKAARIEKAICEKWYIREPFDPAYDFEALGDHLVENHKNEIRLTKKQIIDGSLELSIPSKEGLLKTFVTNELLKGFDAQLKNADSFECRQWLILEKLLPPLSQAKGHQFS